MGRVGTTFYRRFVSMIRTVSAAKLNWIRSKSSFVLLIASIMSIEETKSSRHNAVSEASQEWPIDLQLMEGQIHKFALALVNVLYCPFYSLSLRTFSSHNVCTLCYYYVSTDGKLGSWSREKFTLFKNPAFLYDQQDSQSCLKTSRKQLIAKVWDSESRIVVFPCSTTITQKWFN